jgi:hypothetical protein
VHDIIETCTDKNIYIYKRVGKFILSQTIVYETSVIANDVFKILSNTSVVLHLFLCYWLRNYVLLGMKPCWEVYNHMNYGLACCM